MGGMIWTIQHLTSFRVRVVVEGKQGDACLCLGSLAKTNGRIKQGCKAR